MEKALAGWPYLHTDASHQYVPNSAIETETQSGTVVPGCYSNITKNGVIDAEPDDEIEIVELPESDTVQPGAL